MIVKIILTFVDFKEKQHFNDEASFFDQMCYVNWVAEKSFSLHEFLHNNLAGSLNIVSIVRYDNKKIHKRFSK